MASNRVWNLMYYAGNTGSICSEALNPQAKKSAMAGAVNVNSIGWRGWIEHRSKHFRIWESDAEKRARQLVEKGPDEP